MIYACLTGRPPFESPTIGATIANIKELAFDLPDHFSAEAKDLVSSLLVWDKRERMTVEEVRLHPFFKVQEETMRTSSKSALTIDADCSYFDYQEAFPSPPSAPSLSPCLSSNISLCRAHSHPQTHHDSSLTLEPARLVPLNSSHLSPIRHNTRNGYVEINEEGWVVVLAGKRRIDISKDGLIVYYCGKKVPLSSLSPAAVKLYEYAKDFIHTVQSKTPKVTYENEHGEFLLMWNNPPYQNFEAVFHSGERLLYQVGGEEMVVRRLDGEEVVICPHLQKVGNADIARLVERAMEGLMECFRREKQLAA